MIKTVLVATEVQTKDLALSLAPQYGLELLVATANTAEEAIAVVRRIQKENDVELVIARGAQARRIRTQLALPVVDIQISAQALGRAIQEVKKQLGISHPKIAILTFSNSMCPVEGMGELLGVELTVYHFDSVDEIPQYVKLAKKGGAQMVIGGLSACAEAKSQNLPAFHIRISRECVQEAMRFAGTVAEAMEKEKRNNEETNVLLNYSFSGIIKVNMLGEVQRANYLMESYIGLTEKEMVGKHILQLIPGVEERQLMKALQEGVETYSTIVILGDKELVANIVPLKNNLKIEGAILSFNEGKRIREIAAEMRRELLRRGHVTQCTFSKIVAESPATKKTVERAKLMAKYNAPILICGEPGTGKHLVAQCIHNESPQRKNAFVTLNCSAWAADKLDQILFGDVNVQEQPNRLCAAELAQDGTLFLENIHALAPESQYKLYWLIRGQLIKSSDIRPIYIQVRVIASTFADLYTCMKKGLFQSDLYYALNVMRLEVPPLRQRKEDIAVCSERFIADCSGQNDRFLKLTQGGIDFLREYPWPGNLDQLKSLCESLVFLSPRRSVDELFIRQQLQSMEAGPHNDQPEETALLQADKKSAELVRLLAEYGGNREKVADALGISRSTLWRRMKKYGITSGFTV